ncbi:MAG: nucleotide exchange factor GrpE [Treponema sp.]|jgi:molecular chaperone GrpE|nr:nucleotide exchange factor GrpE [Treponema sp.]
MNEEFAEQTEGMTSENGESGEAAGKTPECLDDKAKIAALEAELAERNDQYLRKAADFENFRKRMIREKQDAIDFANRELLRDILPVIDDFERAIQSAATSQDFNSFYEGIGMIEKQLTSQLESKWGLKRFDSVGEIFDPNLHEALMMERSADVAEPMVKEDLLKGYLLRDRILRPAKVMVVMPEAPSAGDTDSSISADSQSEGIQNSGTEKTGD